MAIDLDRWIPLAEIARAHGVRGEVRLRLYNPDSDLLLEADEVQVQLKDGDAHEVSVDAARRADDAILLKLYSIDDRDRADELRLAIVSMRRRDFPPLEPGEFYWCDAVGARVVLRAAAETAPNGSSEREWGVVEGLRSYPTVQTLAVKLTTGEVVEVPMLEEFVERFDTAEGLVVLKDVDAFEPSAQPKKVARAEHVRRTRGRRSPTEGEGGA
jgi:16S rRNA processing protein RimM